MKADLINQIEDLISEDNLEEAISRSRKYFKNSAHDENRIEITAIASSYAYVEKAHRTKQISESKFAKEKNKITNRLLQFLGHVSHDEPEPQSKLNDYSYVSNISDYFLPGNNFFNPQADYLNALRDLIESDSNPPYITVVWGMAGIGKTFLTSRFAYNLSYEKKFNLIWWVHAETYENIIFDFKQLAMKFHLKEEGNDEQLILGVKKFLKDYSGKWLIIFDNACDEESQFLNLDYFMSNIIPHTSRYKKVIITSRNREWSWRFKRRSIHIQSWSRNDFSSFLNEKGIYNNSKSVSILHDEFEGLPLALAQAAYYIDGRQISLDTFLTLLKENKEKLLEKGIKIDYEKENIVNAIILSYENLEQTLPIQAKLLMGLLSFMAPNHIPLVSISRRIQSLLKKNDIPFQKNNPFVNLERCLDAVDILIKRSLVQKAGNDQYSIHRLIKEGIQFYLKEQPEKYLTLRKEIIETLYHSYQPRDNFYLYVSPYMTFLTPHVHSVLESTVEYYSKLPKETQAEIIILKYRLGLYHIAAGDKKKGERFFKDCMHLINSDPKLKKEEKIAIVLKKIELKACFPAHHLPFSQSQELALAKLKALHSFFSSKNLTDEVIVCINRLGLTHLRNREFDQAVSLFEEALSIEKYDFLYSNLGLVYLEKGELNTAESYFNISSKIASKERNSYVIGMNNINRGIIHGLKKEYIIQKQLLDEAIQIFQKLDEKRFVTFAIYPRLIFDLDRAIYDEQDKKLYQHYLSYNNEDQLKDDLKYRIQSLALKLRLSIFLENKDISKGYFRQFKKMEELIDYYPIESLSASIYLYAAIYFFKNNLFDYAKESLSLAIKYRQYLSELYLEEEFAYWTKVINQHFAQTG